MNKKLIVIVFCAMLLIAMGLYGISANPILGKWLFGSARIIGKPIDAVVMVNGVEAPNAKVFLQTTDFSDQQDRDYLILYTPNKTKLEGRNIMIVDRSNNLVRKPGASNRRDYEVLGGYLFQSESGAKTLIPIHDDIKGLGFNPGLEFNGEIIRFNLPEWSEYEISTVEIIVTQTKAS